MANTLMFEVGVDLAKKQFEAIKSQIENYTKEWKKDLQIKVEIQNLIELTNHLKTLGDNPGLRTLREDIAALNKEFLQLSKGAGGTGSIADRGVAQDIERQSQNIERYTAKIKSLTEERTKLLGGTRNVNYAPLTNEIDKYTLMLEGAKKKLQELQQQGSKPVASANNNAAATFTQESNAAQEAVDKLNKLVAEKQQVVDAEKKLAEVNAKAAQSLSEEGNQAQKTEKQIETVANGIAKVNAEEEKINSAGIDKNVQSFNKASDTVDNLINRLKDAKNVLDNYPDSASTQRLTKYFEQLLRIQQELKLIKDNKGTHPVTGQTASQLMSETNLGGLLKNIKEELRYYEQIRKEIEKIESLKSGLQNVLNGIADPSKRREIQGVIDDLRDFQGMVMRLGTTDARFHFGGEDYKRLFSSAVAKLKESQNEIKKQDTAAKQAEKTNQSWANSIDFARKKVVELSAKIKELEAVESKLRTGKGIDTTALQQSIAEMRHNLSILQQMAAGAKIYGTSNSFYSSSQYQNPILTANSVAKQLNAQATQNLTAEEQKLATALQSSTKEMNSQSQVLSDLRTMAMQYLSVWGAQNFINKIIETGGQLEQQRLSMGAILQDADKANEIFGKIKALAVKSPFGVVQLDQMSKQLAAYGFVADELFDWTKRLADISAATGTEVSRLSLALGHVRSEGALSGYTLRQFAMGNVPMLRMLSEARGVSTKEIRNLVRKKEISDKEVEQVLIKLTSEGGMFYEAQEVMSQALNAKFKNLRDAFDIMFGEIAESGVGGALKDIATALTDAAKQWQRFGVDILGVAAAFGVFKVAALASNIAIGRGTAATLSSALADKKKEVTLLRVARSYRLLTQEEELQVLTSRKLTSIDLTKLLNKKKLTVAELERAVALKKVSAEEAKEAVMASKLSAAMKQQYLAAINGVKPLNRLQRGWLQFRIAAVGAIESVKMALRSLWPMLAIGAAIDLFMRNSQQKQRAEDFGATASGALWKDFKDVSELYNELSSKKPKGLEEASESIERMKEALRGIGRYDSDLAERVNKTEDLSGQYNILYKELEKISQEYVKMAENAKYYLAIANKTGGGLFSDNMLEDIKDFGKANTALRVARMEMNKFGATMKNEIKTFIGSEWRAEFDNMSWRDLYNNVLNDGGRDRFTGYMNFRRQGAKDYEKQLLDDLYDTLIEYRGAIIDFNDAEEEINAQMGEYVKNLQVPLADRMAALGFNWDEKASWEPDALRAFGDTVNKLVQAYVDNGEIDIGTANKLQNKILKSFLTSDQVAVVKTKVDVEIEDDRVGWQKEMQQYFDEHGIDIKIKADTKKKDLIDDLKKRKKELQESVDRNGAILISVGLDLSNLPKEGADAMQRAVGVIGRTFKFFGNAWGAQALVDYQKEKKELDALNEWASGHGVDLSDKKDKGGSHEDKEAKHLRERVRILKEAADSYQYWRKAVGESAAFGHVQAEFGQLLGEQGFNVADAYELKKVLQELLDKYRAIYDATGKKRPQLLEAIKEIDKELAQLDRKDYEKRTEDFMSQMTRDIEELTRKWEIFNSVRESTGDASLASRVSGIAPGATPADLKRANISGFAGVEIDFSRVLAMSNKEIDEYVYTLGVSEDKIKAIQDGLKDWKKAQQDLTKSDLQNYAKWLGSLVDLESVRKRNQDEFNKTLEETNRLRKDGIITEEEAAKRRNSALGTQARKDWEATSTYSTLYNNAQSMAGWEFGIAYSREAASLQDQLKSGTINTSQYADKIQKLNKIMAEFDNRGFLGIKGGLGAYLSGGSKGLSDYYKSRALGAYSKGNNEEGDKWEERAKALDKMQKGAEQVAKVFSDLSQHANLLGNMFGALGNKGAANAFGDAAGVLGGIAGGAQSLSALGPYGMAAGAVIGGITSMAQLHDKQQQRVIDALKEQVSAIEANTSAIKSARERTLGYDNGDLRRAMAKQYANTSETRYSALMDWLVKGSDGTYTKESASKRAMREYYSRNAIGTGYAQELQNLEDEREKYLRMYEAESKKKDESSEALSEYTQKVAELDEQIIYFTQDLANELWGIDFKGWADQISDALWTAFENGEDAVDAFGETAKDIISDVAKRMMNLNIIEPMFQDMADELFGKVNSNGQRTGGAAYNNGAWNESETLRILGEYLGEGGILEKNVAAAEEFYNLAKQATGMDFGEKSDSKSTGNSIKGITEQTADLLAGYINAIRADVAVDRAMIAQYFPMYYAAMTSGNASLRNLEEQARLTAQNTAAIQRNTSDISSLMNGLKNKTWKVPVA